MHRANEGRREGRKEGRQSKTDADGEGDARACVLGRKWGNEEWKKVRVSRSVGRSAGVEFPVGLTLSGAFEVVDEVWPVVGYLSEEESLTHSLSHSVTACPCRWRRRCRSGGCCPASHVQSPWPPPRTEEESSRRRRRRGRSGRAASGWGTWHLARAKAAAAFVGRNCRDLQEGRARDTALVRRCLRLHRK